MKIIYIVLGDKMFNVTKIFTDIMKKLYESKKVTIGIDLDYSFEKMMETNETRLQFLNQIFTDIEEEKLSDECRELFNNSIRFISSFLNGDFKKTISVSEAYENDKNDCLIIPKQSDIDYLYSLINANMVMYESFYQDSEYTIELPKDSFNMNMKRILKVEYYNLAHLFGLTQSEIVEDDNKNLLKKYYLENFNNDEEEKVSTKLLKWFLSEDGKKEIYRLNQLTLDFVIKDKIKYPNSYDENGNIKRNALEGFRKRFKEDPKNEGLDYPIIRFSRYICKCINNLNYFNMANIFQMILDYNAPLGENDEKDIFLVNAEETKLMKNISDYFSMKIMFENLYNGYGKNVDDDKKIENYLISQLLKNGISEKGKLEIKDFLNLYQAYDFVGKHDIKPDTSDMENKIKEFLSKCFRSNVSLIGFGTDFEKDETGEIVITELNDKSINRTHCDTSISVNLADLIDKYYKRGRVFFIDKIYSNPNCTGYVRISNPKEELAHLHIIEYYDQREEVNKKIESLDNLFNMFNEKYNNYMRNYLNGKSR